jgi:oligosaccharyltransferase complex subunit beta
MFSFRRWSLLALFAFAASAFAKSSTGDSVLVVLDPALDKAKYSIFFDGLKKNGYELTFRAPKDTAPLVLQDGVANFAHVIVFAPDTKTYASDITPQSLVELLTEGTNLILALSANKQTPLTSLAPEFALTLPPPGTPLMSHFPERDTPRTVIPIEPPENPVAPILSPDLPPVWFSGVPFVMGNNPLLVPILKAPAESFASDTTKDDGGDALFEAWDKGGEGLWAGQSLGVVTGFQTLGGARATWVGGVEMFSDEFIKLETPDGKKSGNEQFAREVAAWTFQESLVLRVDSIAHHRVNKTEQRKTYTTSDEVTYTTQISKFNSKTADWEPYSDIKDMQLEFTMLDPHIRTSLPPKEGKKGVYEVSFRVPDRHGVFKFVVDYKRKGWTHLHSSTVVPVVPPRHDEYARFLPAAWPYYAGALSTSVAFVIFAALWLGGEEKETAAAKKTKKE